MKLLLDIGNSRIKWTYQAGPDLVEYGSVGHAGQPPEAAARFVDRLPHAPTAVGAVNVAGAELGGAVSAKIRRLFDVQVDTVSVAASWGPLRNGYTDFRQLGADRWAAMVGAWCRHSGAGSLLVVDAGTALTVDAVAADGQHRGGLIVPGLSLMQSTLGQATSDVARFADATPRGESAGDGWLGTSTREATASGARVALCALVQHSVRELEQPVRVVLTGGDAAELAAGLPDATEVRPLLVLEGLQQLLAEPD